MNKEKIMIFPYDREALPLVTYSNLLADYTLTSVVSPPGFALQGKDAGFMFNDRVLNIPISDDFERELEYCDTVLITEPALDINFKETVYPNIIFAVQSGKNIVITGMIDETLIQELEDLCRNNCVSFKYINAFHMPAKKYAYDTKAETILPINTPVIFVLGTGEYTQKFHIQLAIRQQFLDAGYTVTQVGSRSYSELFGFHPIPVEIFNARLTEHEKVIFFNRFIKDLEDTEHPDVIVIGIPGNIFPFDKMFTNKFGLTASIISYAVTPDAAVLSSIYDTWNDEYFDEMFTFIKIRFGFEVDCFNLSPTMIDWDRSNEKEKLSYNFLDPDMIKKQPVQYTSPIRPVFTACLNNEMEELSGRLMSRLMEYGEVPAF